MPQASSVPVNMGRSTELLFPSLQAIGPARLKKLASTIEKAAVAASGSAATHAADSAEMALETTRRFVFLLDPPAFAVAWSLQRGVAKDIDAALDQWLDFAEQALRQWNEAPSQVLLIDGFSRDAAAVAAAVAQWDDSLFGLRLADEADRNVETTLLMLANRACAASPRVAAALSGLADAGMVFDELKHPLVPVEETEPPIRQGRVSTELPQAQAPSQEQARLRQCLDDAQRELEAVYLKLLEASGGAGVRSASGGGRPVRAAHVRLSQIEGTEAAVSLQLEVRDLEVAGLRMVPRLRAELHLIGGDPEFRLFGTSSDLEILGAWNCDGTSGGRPYMRFRTADAEGRRRLEMLGSGDWQLMVAVVSLLHLEVDRLGGAAPQTWRVAAARLRRQVGSIPARFRYDSLRVSAAETSPDAVDLCFQGAGFGALPLQRVQLRWSGNSLDWRLNSGEAELPLTVWPIDDAGVPGPSWAVPVGRDLGRRAHAETWQAMPHEDRELVLAVLDALPAVAAVASDEVARRRGGREAMAASAAALLRGAHLSLNVGRIRGRLRRVRGLGWL